MNRKVIDILSSPEPEIPPVTGKRKAPEPIVIADSDEEEDAPKASTSRGRKRPRQTPRAKRQPRPLHRAHAQESTENVAGPSGKGKGRATEPLFLAGEEENEPPSSPSRARIAVAQAPDATRTPSPVPPADPPETALVQTTAPPDPHEVMSGYVAQVLEIIPDVQPEHVHGLVERHYAQYKDHTLETVLHVLFEDKSYPKVDRKGKRKRTEADDVAERKGKKTKVDYASIERDVPSGPYYYALALEYLQRDFPYIPVGYIRSRFHRCHFLYAPAYLALAEESKGQKLPYKQKSVPYRVGKGKMADRTDDDLEKEREFVLQKKREEEEQRDAALAEQMIEKEYEESGEGIECGCCFTSYPFFKMIQCTDAHLFCKDCMLSYAETKLGSHDIKITCMDQSGCKELFPESELRRLLPAKLMALYDRVKQRKEIEQAGLDGLEECPFCEYKCVIENPDEKLFRCGNVDDCGAISCRSCKKLDHLPKTCKEVEEDKKLDSQHLVEEAMSKALVRNCPNNQCRKPFIKDDGCNKIVCTNCRTLSCYLCRKVIAGYEHFDQTAPGTVSRSNKCRLWDGPVERRHAEEVGEAAKRALEEYKRNNPNAREDDIRVDVPEAPPELPPRFPAPRAAPPALPPLVQPVYPHAFGAPAPVQPQPLWARAGAYAFGNAVAGPANAAGPAGVGRVGQRANDVRHHMRAQEEAHYAEVRRMEAVWRYQQEQLRQQQAAQVAAARRRIDEEVRRAQLQFDELAARLNRRR